MTFRLSPTYRYFGLAGMVALEQGTTDTPANLEAVQGKLTSVPYYWNPNTLSFEVARQVSTAAGSTTIDANLTSAGSTKEVGYFRLANPTTAVDATLSSAGSTRIVGTVSNATSTGIIGAVSLATAGTTATLGQVAISNPTTSVTLTNPTTKVDLGQVTSTPGSSNDYIWTRSVSAGGAGSTEVDASLTSLGSTRLVGRVDVNSISSSTAHLGSVAVTSGTVLGPSTAAIGQLTSGTQTVGTVLNATSTSQIGSVSLLAGSSANMLGAVALGAGSSGTMLGTFVISSGTSDITIGGVVIESGSSANVVGGVALLAASTAIVHGAVAVTSGVVLGPSTAMTGMISSGTQQIGSVALVTGTTNTMGAMAQGAGSSANFWTVDSFAFTSGQTSRSSVSTTVDIQIVAANANRKGLVIANRSTAQTVGVGFSTAVVTTALANVDVFIPPSGHISFGFQGTLPLYLGPLRGINLTSTAVAGSVGVVQFLNT